MPIPGIHVAAHFREVPPGGNAWKKMTYSTLFESRANFVASLSRTFASQFAWRAFYTWHVHRVAAVANVPRPGSDPPQPATGSS